jgi:hypothetical protein
VNNNLVGEMLVGRVGFGESFQACPTNYSAEDAMARSIVRLECENEELRAEVAMLKQGMVMLAQERDEAREALIPFISLNPNSQRVKEKWDGFVQAAKKALEAAK